MGKGAAGGVGRGAVEEFGDVADASFFEMLFEEMHDANHTAKRPDARGKLWGDAVNKHAGVGKAARRLEQKDKKMDGIEVFEEPE